MTKGPTTIRRTWPERAFIAGGVLLAVGSGALAATAETWLNAAPFLACCLVVGMVIGNFSYNTKPQPLRGRAIWLGPIGGFVAMYGDGAEPFARWGITRGQRVEIRVVHDNVDEAFASYVTPTPTLTPTRLAGQPTGGVIGVDAVGGDVVAEPSGSSGKPTSSTDGPPAGA